MTHVQDNRPWEEINELAIAGDAERLEEVVDSLSPGEVARAMAHLDPDERSQVLETLTPADAADLLEELPDAQATEMIEHLRADVAASIIHELPSDEQADFIGDLDEDEAEAILSALDPVEAEGIRELARFGTDTAGGLMATEFLSFSSDASAQEVVRDLRANAESYAGYDVQYAYVHDQQERLVGVLRLRDLLLTPDRRSIADIMIKDPVAIAVASTIDEIADEFEHRNLFALPVYDEDGRMLGVVRRHAVEEALAERAEDAHRKARGIVGGEELRSMPLLRRSGRRLSWLSINIVLNVVAASVIAVFEETLAAVIALAFFLPIISDMSGCSGNQAVAVSIRELTLGVVRPHELLWVWLKEIGVGVINGLILGLLIGVVAYLWKGNGYLGLVGAALAANTMVAVSIGGLVPLVLKRFDMDPALASGPVLTTITDICGFFFVLGFATVLLEKLAV